MRHTVVIVGGGFSGTVLAAKLLRRPPAQPTDLVLIERGGSFGRGVAYASRDFPYLLNVPAERLSADSLDPLQFLRFAQTRIAAAEGGDFLPRSLYGDYLQDLLLQAEHAAAPQIRLLRVIDEVIRLERVEGLKPLVVGLANRSDLLADTVVLALGNPPPPVLPWADEIRQHAAFRQDPWDLPETLTAAHSVLIVGNGLTMADATLALSRNMAHTPTLHSLSRRGLLPQSQSTFHSDALRGGAEALLSNGHSIRRLMRIARSMSAEVEAAGGDWREVVTFIRNLAPKLWRGLPETERRRFVRHLQSHWSIHRHRLPPQWGERIDALRSSGKLRVSAGRIQHITAVEQQLCVSWVPRGSDSCKRLTVDLVVNAVGPDYVLERSVDPLLSSLRKSGLICADALQLGIRTAGFGACVDRRGQTSAHLFYLGPMLRAGHWEATGAAELRDHAEALAAHLAHCAAA